MSPVGWISSFLRVLLIAYSCGLVCFSVVVAVQLQQLYKQCPERCSCYNRMTTVDCRESGLFTVPILPNTSTHLYLQANRLHHLTHYAFHFAPELHVLNLRENVLKVLDTYAFAGLQELEHIDVRQNRITGLKLSPEPDSILSKLKDIDMSNNRLASIPTNLSYFAPNLQALNLSSNHIATAQMDVSYASMHLLQRLDLSANRITRLSGDHLDAIRALPLRSLSLAGCSLDELHEDALANLINLTSLTLADNPIPVNQLSQALSGLGPDNHLISLNLNGVALINATAGMFEALVRLEALSMSQCSLSHIEEGIFDVLTDLRAVHLQSNNLHAVDNINNLLQLHHLDLSNNFISELNISHLYNLEVVDLSNNTFQSLPSNFITNTTNLRILNLRHNDITRISYDAFSGVTILRLDLSYNRLTTLDSAGSYSCTTLDVSHNLINDVKPAALKDVSTSLRHLDLSHNNITYFNTTQTFPNMYELQRLDLSYNRLGSNLFWRKSSPEQHQVYDSQLLFNGLGSLLILDLSANNISFLSAQSMHSFRHLTALYLRHNPIVDVRGLRLDKLTALLQLDLSDNHISTLDAHGLLALDYLQAVDLAYNPFYCDCSAMPLIRWLNRTRVSVLGISDHLQYRCAEPDGTSGRYLLSFQADEEQCLVNVHDVRWDLTLFAITVASVLLATALSTLFIYCSRLCQCVKALHYRWQVRYREVSAVEFHQDQKV